MGMKKQIGGQECAPGIAGGNEEEYAKHLKYSKDFIDPVQDEVRRLSIDSAKKRAAAQHADYPTFAAIVSAAQLKPFHRNRYGLLTAGEDQAVRRRASPAWFFDAKGGLQGKQEANSDEIVRKIADIGGEDLTCADSKKLDQYSGCSSPSHPLQENQREEGTGIDPNCICFDGFMRNWRKFGRAELGRKLDFLLQINPQQLSQIFKVEIPPSVLADIVETVHRGYARDSSKLKKLDSMQTTEKTLFDNPHENEKEDGNPIEDAQQILDSMWVLGILEALGKCGRFSLSLKLIGHKARSMASDLCSMVLINNAVFSLEKGDGVGYEEKDRVRSFSESSSSSGLLHSGTNMGSNIVELVQKLQKLYGTEKDLNQKK